MSKKKVLVIDDEEDFCRAIKKALEMSGKYQVITAHDARTGKKAAIVEKPDIILLDIVMPGASGSELSENLLNNPETRSIPIIFVTAIVTRKEVHSGALVGNRIIIPKPVNIQNLEAKMQKLLSAP
ncbi:response regulator [Desulfonatronum sp. SC1]|uniref:response regulator n=1 Tax=Desulfonatronum sp. SC1 TaxID=2109626 RepID=UPI000D3227E6|nr:response regulator [Desulfonatronum sp. SC1]PTN37729.1 two-component system response regulator [Desulfonatronum sp. SC1]